MQCRMHKFAQMHCVGKGSNFRFQVEWHMLDSRQQKPRTRSRRSVRGNRNKKCWVTLQSWKSGAGDPIAIVIAAHAITAATTADTNQNTDAFAPAITNTTANPPQVPL